MPPRIFLIAGEESGDRLGAGLVEELRRLEPAVECEGLGGRRMAAAGCRLRQNLVEHAVMGIAAVLKKLPFFRRVYRETVAAIALERPDLVIPIDYPGLNMRIAKAARRAGVPVLYYVSPQVWAWRRGRLRKMKRAIDKMLVLFPFEAPLYRDRGIAVEWVGHPMLDAIAAERPDPSFLERIGVRPGEPLVGLLPGSRAQELKRLLPVVLDAAAILKSERSALRFAVPCAKPAFRDAVARAVAARPALAGAGTVAVLDGEAHEVLRNARAALVASGTATLECLCFGLPLVILYNVGPVTYLLSKAFLHTKHIGMVNILAGRGVVPELLDFRDRSREIAAAALPLLDDGPERERVRAELAALRGTLGGEGASRRAAEAALAMARTATEPKALARG